MDPSTVNDQAIRLFLGGVVLSLLSCGLTVGGYTNTRLARLLFGCAAVFTLPAIFWPMIAPNLTTKIVSTASQMASNSWVWFGTFAFTVVVLVSGSILKELRKPHHNLGGASSSMSVPQTAAVAPEPRASDQLFDLGVTLGRLKTFDPEQLSDLHRQCKTLGLTFSAARLGRILDVWDEDFARMEERGGSVSAETVQMFDFQMKDMQDAIRSDIARLSQRGAQVNVVAAPDSIHGFERYLSEKKRPSAAEWQPLTNEQKAALIAGWRQTLEGKELQITHNGLFDCERLATELADVLRDSGVKLIGPPSTDEEPIIPGVWICAFGGNTDEIGAQLAIGMTTVRLCQPQIVAPVGRWVRMRIGQKTKKQVPWTDD